MVEVFGAFDAFHVFHGFELEVRRTGDEVVVAHIIFTITNTELFDSPNLGKGIELTGRVVRHNLRDAEFLVGWNSPFA